jgi:hypothetical protein
LEKPREGETSNLNKWAKSLSTSQNTLSPPSQGREGLPGRGISSLSRLLEKMRDGRGRETERKVQRHNWRDRINSERIETEKIEKK